MRRASLPLLLIAPLLIAMAVYPTASLAGNGFSCSNSATCQYVENVPGGSGSHPTSPPSDGGPSGGGGGPSGGGGGPSSVGAAVSPGRAAVLPAGPGSLDAHGNTGRATANLAAATAPHQGIPTAGGPGPSSAGGNPGSTGSGDSPSGSALKGIPAELTGSDSGMGMAFPIVLGLSLLGALLVVLLRWRRGTLRA
jgi:hypothetical protein